MHDSGDGENIDAIASFPMLWLCTGFIRSFIIKCSGLHRNHTFFPVPPLDAFLVLAWNGQFVDLSPVDTNSRKVSRPV